ncbi:MAG: hypothetical protein ACRDNJ_14310 [Solirubrobacteraceae bacterium]
MSSERLAMLDHFRVPYGVDSRLAAGALQQIRCPDEDRTLMWMRTPDLPAVAATLPGADGKVEIPLFATVVGDDEVQAQLARFGDQWSRARTIVASDGTPLGSIWRSKDGSVFLPFDPCEVVENFWSERYLTIGAGSAPRLLRRVLMLLYYRARPLLGRPVQIWLRRGFARLQARSRFPRWPVETCLQDFFDLMFAILSGIAGRAIPRIAAWPTDYQWALVLSHDVEQADGFAALEPVLELERRHGMRSSWNLVPRRYPIDPERVQQLLDDGFEVGVHGLHHDGRDLESLALWEERLPHAYEAAAQWGGVGFRSAALHRDWDRMRELRFDYDSSIPDTDPFEPQDGGCCSWLPFFNGGVIELPLTLPQDHTLFVILRQRDETAWVQKAEFLRARGGLAMIDTHPDYLVDQSIFRAYSRFLDRFCSDTTAWKALPREVSAWWRRRAASWIEHDGEGWRVFGPAADEARVELEWRSW